MHDHNILEVMDKTEVTALVLLDLSKAFDSVSHSILLHKVTSIDAFPQTVKWFESYLSDRTQFVRIGSTESFIPKGAILSPLSFCIYTNDLPSTTRYRHLDSYVDD